jgi:hypothetical protein
VTNNTKNGRDAGLRTVAAAILTLLANTLLANTSLAGSLVDAASRMVAPARAARVARPSAPALILLPSSSAIQSLSRAREFAQPGAQKARPADPYGDPPDRGGLNLHSAFPIKWESTPANLNPKIVSLARNFRRNGLPLVHLWGSGRNLLALGLNPHGKPGRYFTQNMD